MTPDEDYSNYRKLKSMMMDTQKVGYRHLGVVQHSKIFRYCTCAEHKLLLHSAKQAKCLVHESQGLAMAALELSFPNFLPTYPVLYRFIETTLSCITPLRYSALFWRPTGYCLFLENNKNPNLRESFKRE